MKKIHTFILLFSLLSTPIELLGQIGKHSIDENTNQIFEFNNHYKFNLVAKYSYSINDYTSPAIKGNFMIIIKIGADGTGELTATLLNSKHKFTIVSCFKQPNYYLFNIINSKGVEMIANLRFDNNNMVTKFILKTNEKDAAVYFN